MTEKQKQIADGKEAKMLLEHPMLVKAFNDILNDGYQKWMTTNIDQKEEREAIYHAQVGLMRVKQVLVNAIDNGKILEEEVKNDG